MLLSIVVGVCVCACVRSFVENVLASVLLVVNYYEMRYAHSQHNTKLYIFAVISYTNTNSHTHLAARLDITAKILSIIVPGLEPAKRKDEQSSMRKEQLLQMCVVVPFQLRASYEYLMLRWSCAR